MLNRLCHQIHRSLCKKFGSFAAGKEGGPAWSDDTELQRREGERDNVDPCRANPQSQAQLGPQGLDVVLGDQCDHGVRGDAHVERGETGIEAERPSFLHRLHSAVERALVLQLPGDRVRLLLLHLRLHVVERQREEGREEACDRRCAERQRRSAHAVALQHVLAGGVKRQHAEVQGHGARRRGDPARHQARGAVTLDDERHGREDVGVTGALRHRLHAVRLHADERQVRRVPHNGCESASSQRTPCVLGKAQRLSRLLDLRGEDVEQAQARARVHHLSREASRQARVERRETLVLEHIAGDRHRSSGLRRACKQLDADLDHVDGLDADRGGHARQRARGERLQRLPRRIVGHGCWREWGGGQIERRR
mmetsp:Transcript_122686/g.333162  ORF Transcript_122686/g.333162 Transcript_122686/m.333162 type:complete len:367 (+) Transcript_122686:204-1304(+)